MKKRPISCMVNSVQGRVLLGLLRDMGWDRTDIENVKSFATGIDTYSIRLYPHRKGVGGNYHNKEGDPILEYQELLDALSYNNE